MRLDQNPVINSDSLVRKIDINAVSFDKKFDSLAYLVCDKLKETMDKKFRAFNFKVDLSKYPDYDIGEKVGEDATINKKIKSLKDFLDG